MHPINSILNAPFIHKIKVWVLAPHLVSADANIDYYYDFTQSIEEYKKVFSELKMEWKWQPVTMLSYSTVIREIIDKKNNDEFFPVVLNICDGDEINGTPGISVVKLLEEAGLIFTGADEFFYHVTTSKIPMKEAFDQSNVSNAKWKAIYDKENIPSDIFQTLGKPVIIKPAVSGGSMGLGIKNVVENEFELKEQVDKMFNGYRGWNLMSDGIVAEAFINGNEYTTMIVGSYDDPKNAIIFNPVERIFHASLPDKEKILSFDRLWEIYEDESAMPNEENFYEYVSVENDMNEKIKKLSWDAYVATKGKGYTRVDIRKDKKTNQLFILEVNAQCGLSDDENYTSIGAILRVNNFSFTHLVLEILNDAYRRYQTKNKI